MGYYVHINNSGNFRIEADQLKNVYDALIRLNSHDDLKRGGSYGPEEQRKVWFSWMPEDYSYMESAEEILREVGFDFEVEADGSLFGFQYDNKQGCEDVFLAACAPFIADGLFLDWSGEDGEHWRYLFEGGVMKVIAGEITYTGEALPLAINRYFHDEDGKFSTEQIIVSDLINPQEV